MATKTFNISFPKPLADAIDKKAREQFGSRSDFLRFAAQKYLREEQEFEELMNYGKKLGQKVGLRTEESVAQQISSKRRQNRAW
jgi:metal-responsive CopG/Arc/MetJ family transcriptional regulator